jgi:hypothetical protein
MSKENFLIMKQFLTRTLIAAALASACSLCSSTSARAADKVYPTDLTNIAAASNGGRILGATSIFENSTDWNPENLIDGKVYDPQSSSGSMGWSSNKFDPINMDSVTLTFADGAIKRIGKVVVNPTAAVPPERWAKDIEVQVSTESAEGPYRTAALLTLRREAKPQEFLILPSQAKYVRFLFRANQGSDRAVALGEIEIYEAIPQTDPLGQLIASMTQAVSELKQYRDLDVSRRNSGTLAQGESTPDASISNASGELSAATVQMVQLALRESPQNFPISNRNIAAAKNGGKVMNYSSLFGNDANFAAKNLIDGQVYNQEKNTGSWGWSSEGFTPGREYVTLGFGDDRTHLVGKIVLNPGSNQALLRWARRVDVQATSGSAKDGPWRVVGSLTMRAEPTNQEFIMRPFEAKYVRFVFQANGPSDINLPGLTPGVNSDRSVSMGEIEIYEASSATDALNSVIGRFEGILADLKNLRKQSVKVQAEPKPESAQVS